MRPTDWSTASLRRRLLVWLLLPLIGLIALNAWWTYGRAVQVADEAHDRSLYLATRTLAEELQWVDGSLRFDVLKGAGYRIGIRATTGTSIGVYGMNFPSNAAMAALPGGVDMYWTQRDSGDWTDTNTRRLAGGLHYCEITA